MKFRSQTKVDLMKSFVLGITLVGLYYSTFSWLVDRDWSREDYSYGYLIPFVVLYLIWEKRKLIKNSESRPTWLGLMFIIPGLLLHVIGELSGEFFSLYMSFWLVLVGIFLLLLGWDKIINIGFALLLLLAMFPLPNFIHGKITLKLKLISTQIGVGILHAYGMSAFREGNVIDLGFTQLQVVDACSGLRYLLPLIIMGLLLAYFYKARFWKKIVLVLSAIPLTIFTNSFRIAMTGILYELWGPAVAEGFFHGFSGWFIFMFAMAILLLEMWILSGFRSILGNKLAADAHGQAQTSEKKSKVPKVRSELKSEEKKVKSELKLKVPKVEVEGIPETRNTDHETSWIKSFLQPPQFIVAVVLLSATLALSQGVEFREKIPMSRSFSEFPLQVGDWTGKRDVLELKFIEELDFKDYIIVDYRDEKTGKMVNFYTAYYDSQRKGESIHSPETCLPGGGWEFKNAGKTTVTLSPEKMTINRAFILQGAAKQLTYYWFPLRNRIATNLWEVKAYNFWDALTRQRTDGALVRLVTPVYKDEEVADADKRLTAFTREIVPVLKEFLPK